MAQHHFNSLAPTRLYPALGSNKPLQSTSLRPPRTSSHIHPEGCSITITQQCSQVPSTLTHEVSYIPGTGSVAHTREAVPGKKGAEAPRTWEPSSQHQCHQQNLAPLSRATARLCVPSGGLRTSVSICAIQEPKDRPAPPTVTSVLRCHLSLMPLLVPICSLGGPEHWPTPSNTTGAHAHNPKA